jgi:hypothetical protein
MRRAEHAYADIGRMVVEQYDRAIGAPWAQEPTAGTAQAEKNDAT